MESNRLHLLGFGCEGSELEPRTAVLTEVFEIRIFLQRMFYGGGSCLHSRHVGSAARPSKWAFALRNGVCPDRKMAR